MVNIIHLLGTFLLFTASATSTGLPMPDKLKTFTFSHPGVFLSSVHLDRMKNMVAAEEQPWLDAYNAMLKTQFAKRVIPSPREEVHCGANGDPDEGCSDERYDAMATYVNALAWATKGETERARADRAILFLDEWAKTIKNHTGANAPLQTAWAASVWVRAAEIILYSHKATAGWKPENVNTFKAMIRDVYKPLVENGSANPNNWDLMLMEASVFIAVFLDDEGLYKKSVARFVNSTSYYIYLTTDGETPRIPDSVKPKDRQKYLDHWWKLKEFKEDGIGQEICRDLVHDSYGLASVSHVAETTSIQAQAGILKELDMYEHPDVGERLRAALEFQTKYAPLKRDPPAVAVPDWLCNGTLKDYLGNVTEPAYNYYTGRSFTLPYTKPWTAKARPARGDSLFIAFETLTHARGKL